MLIDVPRGTTRLQIRLETPALFSTQSIVIGKVAEEELVEKAVTRAGLIALKWRKGFTRAMNLRKRGRPTNIKKARPKMTVKKKRATDSSEPMPVVMKTFATRQKTPRGKNFITMWVNWIIV